MSAERSTPSVLLDHKDRGFGLLVVIALSVLVWVVLILATLLFF